MHGGAVRQRDGAALVDAQGTQRFTVGRGQLQAGQARRPARLATADDGTQRAAVMPLAPQRQRERFVDGAAVAGDQQRGPQLAVGIRQRVDEAGARRRAQQHGHRHFDALPWRRRQRARGQDIGLGDRRRQFARIHLGRGGRHDRGAARRHRIGLVIEMVGQRDGAARQGPGQAGIVVGARLERALPAGHARMQRGVARRQLGQRLQRGVHGARLVVGLGEHDVDAQRRGVIVVEQGFDQLREPVPRPGPAAEGTQAGVVDVDDDDVVARRGHRRQRDGLAHVVERELQAGQRRDRRDDHVPGTDQPQRHGHQRQVQRGMPALEAPQRTPPGRLADVRVGIEPGVRRRDGRRFPVGRGAHAATRKWSTEISSGRTASACRPGR